MKEKGGLDIVEFILPKGILAYFDLQKVDQTTIEIHLFLTEKNNPPEEYAHTKLTSKGFFDEIKIRDFPSGAKLCIFSSSAGDGWMNLQETQYLETGKW